MCDFTGIHEDDRVHGEWPATFEGATANSTIGVAMDLFGGQNRLMLTSSERELLRELEAEGLNEEAACFGVALTAAAVAAGILLTYVL